MTDNNLKIRNNIVDLYQQAFTLHGDTPSAVLWPRGRQALRFATLTRHITRDNFSILDYGCGLAHLKSYLDEHFINYEYYGADLVPEFVNTVANKYPDAKVKLVRSYKDVISPVDHVVISGTFNIIEGTDRTMYIEQVYSALKHLFSLSRVSLSVNFMTDRVDFMQPQALHMNVEQLMDFTRRHLSPRLMLDESYMPYEFTLVILKDAEIVRPDNIYRPL